MSGYFVRRVVLILLAAMLVVGGFAGSIGATEHDGDETEDGAYVDPGYDVDDPTFGVVVKEEYAGTNKAAATRVRKAFLQAKKAFHEARQEIQAIKKGDESPVEDVPTFFDDDGEDD